MDKSLYDQFYKIEADHWWFAARREIVLNLIERYIPAKSGNAILDVGCGAGMMIEYLKSFGHVRGLDFSEEAVRYGNLRMGNDTVIQLGNLSEDVPFENESYSLITLLDVIEHIDDELNALKTVCRLLRQEGLLVCTVPAYQFLWSGHDVLNHHKRRYTRKELKKIIIASGFEIEKISYFNSFLAPFVLLSRFISSSQKRMEPKSDFKIYPQGLNTLLKKIFLTEKYLLPYISFPFGISLICVARKGTVSE